MKAKTAQIYVDGVLILQAKNVMYDGSQLKLTGIVYKGTVENVIQPAAVEELVKLRADSGTKSLEIRLSLI